MSHSIARLNPPFLNPLTAMVPSNSPPPLTSLSAKSNRFTFIRRWIDRLEIRSPWVAHLICKLIPCTCPFEHRFTVFGYGFHTPPLCELNPFYDEFVSLRFRALSYLSDVCGEDIEQYIC